MKPEVQTLVSPLALDIPEVKRELALWYTHSSQLQELAMRMQVGGAAVIVGTTDPFILEGAAVVVLPGNFTEDAPWVIHFHNRGGHALTEAMIKDVVAFIKAAGYTTFKALNQSGRKDTGWLRVFKSAGKPHFIGSAYFFDLTSEVVQDASDPIAGRRTRHRAKRGTVRPKSNTATVKSKPRNNRSVKSTNRPDKARVRATRRKRGRNAR